MTLSTNNNQSSLASELETLIKNLPDHPHGKLIERALGVLLRIADEEVERLDWKILTTALEDLEKGFKVFHPYRHTRKVTIFGSARLSPQSSEYRLAVEFARYITQFGFMVLTGAGGGIMQAGNEGAGREHSFGLNIELPFEQGTNPFIAGDDKLIKFQYFFTRKLFFLKESDAVALFPGGFGTQDEAFETLTLCQTGKYGPSPLVLIDEPGGDYWKTWNEYNYSNLLARGLISAEDSSLYTITDSLATACNIIRQFYCVYHSIRYVEDLLVMRLNSQLTDEQVAQLNEEYSDILVKGKIEKSSALPAEMKDETSNLPRLTLHFNRLNSGRLYKMINQINKFGICLPIEPHPEWK
ncbi:LOG family protein [Crocosphaera sp. XPORK-15E]|uniref:LOG family protein n=1 Tax=Crocosphaera sp. XPORK-15E TaxID=3110247 RepID=UPI002B213A42|nr:LOG family protein [Crocosphaera sp. XPORK-15E]MEA5533327.1 LOG family protein [Crocosphaera sp. XPORK-15E]